ncbi:MAG: YgaP-like transmembrane domain, partial [Candidatus Nanohalobium sp.]
MEKNVGDTDGLVRMALGAVLGLVSLVVLAQEMNMVSELLPVPAIASPVLGVLAVVLLATGYTSKCALYSALGVDTSE